MFTQGTFLPFCSYATNLLFIWLTYWFSHITDMTSRQADRTQRTNNNKLKYVYYPHPILNLKLCFNPSSGRVQIAIADDMDGIRKNYNPTLQQGQCSFRNLTLKCFKYLYHNWSNSWDGWIPYCLVRNTGSGTFR